MLYIMIVLAAVLAVCLVRTLRLKPTAAAAATVGAMMHA